MKATQRSGPVAAAALFVAVTAISGCHRSEARGKQVIVLGVDGMDPTFLENHWTDLPNLAHLRDKGGFQRLATTMPPQSPVAWSTFITGLDPAGHGIFDFVHRDRSTMAPFSSMSRAVDASLNLPLGPYVLPLRPAHFETLRHGRAFWQILSGRHVPVTIVRMPVNFPPDKAGNELAGMGVPDLRGTEGTFSFYTDDPEELTREVPAGRIVKVPADGFRYRLPIEGPPNSLRRDRRFATQEMLVDVDPSNNVARIALGDQIAVVQQGEWSDWLRADFPLLGPLAKARGMLRIYVKQLHPRLGLYVTPINADPRAPDLPISAPSSYGRDIAGEIGPFYTQGIPEDTAAYRQGIFSLDEFLAQSRLVRDDEMRLLRYSLAHFREGLLFFYFSAIDQNSHMLWGKHEPQLLEVYRAIDAGIGEVCRRFPSAQIVVMSDHGFTSFDRAVNLNTWLWEKGFLALHGLPRGDDEGFADVDWSKTQAYALGLNGIYVNLAGREKFGIVHPGADANAVMERLSAALTALRDPQDGRQVIEAVPRTGARQGPDLIAGYARGYRASWETALGGAPPAILEDNRDTWIGDHCINAADVPGVLLSNRPIRAASLKDLSAAIVALF